MSAIPCTFPGMPRKKLPDAEKKDSIAAKIDPKLKQRVEEMAERDRRTLSWMVEEIIRRYFEREDKRKG